MTAPRTMDANLIVDSAGHRAHGNSPIDSLANQGNRPNRSPYSPARVSFHNLTA
jgi:hypothetical protein